MARSKKKATPSNPQPYSEESVKVELNRIADELTHSSNWEMFVQKAVALGQTFGVKITPNLSFEIEEP